MRVQQQVFIALVFAILLIVVMGWMMAPEQPAPEPLPPAEPVNEPVIIEEPTKEMNTTTTIFNITGPPPSCILDLNTPCER